MRLVRRRKARGVRCIVVRVDIGERDVAELVRRGYLSEREQWDDKAIAFALLAAATLVLGSITANAQTQQPGSFQALTKNATPIVTQAACNGYWGRWCPPGRHRFCGPYRCWCAPC